MTRDLVRRPKLIAQVRNEKTGLPVSLPLRPRKHRLLQFPPNLRQQHHHNRRTPTPQQCQQKQKYGVRRSFSSSKRWLPFKSHAKPRRRNPLLVPGPTMVPLPPLKSITNRKWHSRTPTLLVRRSRIVVRRLGPSQASCSLGASRVRRRANANGLSLLILSSIHPLLVLSNGPLARTAKKRHSSSTLVTLQMTRKSIWIWGLLSTITQHLALAPLLSRARLSGTFRPSLTVS